MKSQRESFEMLMPPGCGSMGTGEGGQVGEAGRGRWASPRPGDLGSGPWSPPRCPASFCAHPLGTASARPGPGRGRSRALQSRRPRSSGQDRRPEVRRAHEASLCTAVWESGVTIAAPRSGWAEWPVGSCREGPEEAPRSPGTAATPGPTLFPPGLGTDARGARRDHDILGMVQGGWGLPDHW